MKEEKIKEAFSRIKEDILNLGKEISGVRASLLESAQLMRQINEDIIELKIEKIAKNEGNLTKLKEKIPTETPTHIPTHKQETPTHPITPTETPTHPQEIQGLKSQNLPFSIGNEGVPTDR